MRLAREIGFQVINSYYHNAQKLLLQWVLLKINETFASRRRISLSSGTAGVYIIRVFVWI